MNITNDISTRLLAQENILINRAPVSTASFDVKNRILTLPMWQNMTPEMEEMLKAHEVGHALYTDHVFFEKFRKEKIPFGYLNILEDARIEKLMKRKYPGLRRTFTTGYVQLEETGFFGDHKSKKMLLIDRINLWFKVGYKSGVKFSVAEKYLVEKAEKMESINDVIVVAQAVYDFTKREQERKLEILAESKEYKELDEEKKQDLLDDLLDQINAPDGFDDDDWSYTGDPVDDEDEDEESEGSKGNGAKQDKQFVQSELEENGPPTVEMDDLISTTDAAFNKNLEQSADVSTQYVYVTLPKSTAPELVIDYKTVLAETTMLLGAKKSREDYRARVDAKFDAFKNDTNRVVNYLVKEFEMKKAASNYKRTFTSKTGVLDVSKIANYQIREDLFKQVTIIKDGQKHGMIFTIDWSGSMTDYLLETVKQLISLVMFCYRTKIPFEVYAFSDNFNREESREFMKSYEQKNTLAVTYAFRMIQFFSHKMTLGELNRMIRNLYVMANNGCFRQVERNDENEELMMSIGGRYELNGTPLNEAMVWMYDYCETFKKNNQIELLTVIKLTDGDARGMNQTFGEQIKEYTNNDGRLMRYLESEYISETRYGSSGRQKVITLINDPYTKKTYVYSPVTATNTFCKMIQDRHNAKVVGYHVVGRGRRELSYTLHRYGIAKNATEETSMAIDVRKGFNEDLFFPVEMLGHDEMFFLPNNLAVDEGELETEMGKLTANQIAKKFGKYLGAKKTSRVLLNRFVAAVA